MDPVHGVHLPQEVAYKLGLLDEQTSRVLTATGKENKLFFDPNSREKVTYQQLRELCVLDADTGLWLLPLPQGTVLEVDDHTAVALRAMKVPINMGRFQGHSVSLWDLLHSEYVGAEKRRELVALCCSGRAAALRQVIGMLTTLVEAAEKQPSQATFKGLRKQVSAGDLFRSQLITKQTLDELNQGKRTVQEVTEMDSVRRSLEGGNFKNTIQFRAILQLQRFSPLSLRQEHGSIQGGMVQVELRVLHLRLKEASGRLTPRHLGQVH